MLSFSPNKLIHWLITWMNHLSWIISGWPKPQTRHLPKFLAMRTPSIKKLEIQLQFCISIITVPRLWPQLRKIDSKAESPQLLITEKLRTPQFRPLEKWCILRIPRTFYSLPIILLAKRMATEHHLLVLGQEKVKIIDRLY